MATENNCGRCNCIFDLMGVDVCILLQFYWTSTHGMRERGGIQDTFGPPYQQHFSNGGTA